MERPTDVDYGRPDLAAIKTSVSSDTLTIDSQQFNWHRNCQTLCIPATYDMVITILTPNPPAFPDPVPMPPMAPAKPMLYQ